MTERVPDGASTGAGGVGQQWFVATLVEQSSTDEARRVAQAATRLDARVNCLLGRLEDLVPDSSNVRRGTTTVTPVVFSRGGGAVIFTRVVEYRHTEEVPVPSATE